MKNSGTLLSCVCTLLVSLGLSACGSSSTSSSSSSGISFASAPPATLQVGKTVPLNAVVAGGKSAMVSWSATCNSPGACGQFSPPMTQSGILTTYEAPVVIPAGGMVTLSAAATGGSQSVSAVVMIVSGAPITVTFGAPPPPPTLTTNSGVVLSAIVLNDPIGNGSDWTVSCGTPGACGAVFPLHTRTGDTTFYTAPSSAPPGSTVTITASSTTDSSVSDSASIIISASQPASFLSGSYTFVLSGTDAHGRNCIAGVLQADGMGTITGGEQDIYSFGIGHSHDTFTGSYSIGPDGRGTIMLNTGNQKLGAFGTETLGVVLISASRALITEFDLSASSRGTMDLQTLHSFSVSTLAGGYAFVLSGQDLSQGTVMGSPSFLHMPFTLGGILNVNGPGSISGAGSVVDSNDNGSLNPAQGVTGMISPPDANGRVQITLSLGFLTSNLSMIGYISDAAHVKLVEIDGSVGVTAGEAVGQGTNTGTFSQAGAFAGNIVLAASGATPGTLPPALPMALTATFNSDGVSSLKSGPFDFNPAGVPTTGMVSGAYSVDPAGTGRVTLSLSGIAGGPSTFVVYLTGSSDPPPALEADTAGVTSGFAYPQDPGPFSGLNFQGFYGLNFTLVSPDGTSQSDATGQALADGVAHFAATLDFNGNGIRRSLVPATGTFSAKPTGQFTGSIVAPLIFPVSRGFSYYIVNNSQVVLIESDALGVGLGIFELQLPPL